VRADRINPRKWLSGFGPCALHYGNGLDGPEVRSLSRQLPERLLDIAEASSVTSAPIADEWREK
jgi:hypothetical protein